MKDDNYFLYAMQHATLSRVSIHTRNIHISLLLIWWFVFVIWCVYGGYAQSYSVQELVTKVHEESTVSQQNSIALEIARQKEQYDRNSFLIPKLNFSVYPLQPSYQSVQTFIPSFSVNPLDPQSPLVFSGLSPLRLSNKNNNLGMKVDLKSPTPFGGYTTFELQDFFLFSRDFSTVDQEISFLWTFNQPLFVNNSLLTVNPLRIRLAQIRNEFELNTVLHMRATNEIILDAYQKVLEIVTIQKQIPLLDATLNLLSDNLKALQIQIEKGSDSNKALLSVQSSMALKQKERTHLNDMLTLRKLQLIQQGKLRISESQVNSFVVNADLPSISQFGRGVIDALNNPAVSDAVLALENAQNQLILQDIDGKPTMNLSLSVQPRYASQRESSDFLSSFADLGDENAFVDILFSVEFAFPLLSAYTRGPLKNLQNLVIENKRLELERRVDIAYDQDIEYQNTINTLQFEQEKLHIDIELERLLLNEEQIKKDLQTSTSLLIQRQKLNLAEKELELWEVEKNIFLTSLLQQANRGVHLEKFLIK